LAIESNTYDSNAENDAKWTWLSEALPGFDVADALDRLGGNITCYKELLADLRKSLVEALSALRPLIQGGGIEEASIRLHGLKGICGNLGATALSQLFQSTEQSLATSREEQYEMLITRMEQAIHRHLATIGTFVEVETPPYSDPLPPEAANEDLLIETMHLLACLLDQGRLDAADSYKRLKSLLHHRRPHPEFNNLAAAMGCLDYANARKALTALAASMNIIIL
jgi:two-component system, sensor histidine kinase and response regulator